MNLFRAELTRIAKRRITTATLAIAGLIIAAAAAITFLTHNSGEPNMALAEQQAIDNTVLCTASYGIDSGLPASEIAASCYSDPAWFVQDTNFHLQSILTGNGSSDWDVTRAGAFERSGYFGNETALSGAYGLDGTLAGSGILIALGAVVLGASYVGADWKSGVIESQMVRQPNRRRLYQAKLGAIGLMTAAMALAISTVMVLALLPAAIFRGDTAGTGVGFWKDTMLVIGRISIGAAIFAMIAGTVAMFARNTAAGVVSVLIAFIGGGMIGGVAASWTQYVTLPQNLMSWISQGDVTYMFKQNMPGGGYESYTVAGHGWAFAAALLLAGTAAAVAISATSFSRRDVS